MTRRALAEVSALLRAEGRYAVGNERLPRLSLLTIVLVCGGAYGAAMGSFAGGAGALYAALKVPLLILGSAALCLPNFYVAHAVLGLSDDLRAAVRGLVSAQATFAVVLASLAPVTLFAYAASGDYHTAKLLNGILFAIASLAAQQTLARHYRPLLAKNPRHRLTLMTWPLLYFFVALQLAYALRPFVGNPRFATEFLREDWLGNVYIDLYWSLRGVIG